MEDKLILGYDCSDNDIPTLTVARNIGDKIIKQKCSSRRCCHGNLPFSNRRSNT